MSNAKRAKLIDRFWKKVRKTAEAGCWLWTGSTIKGGYGTIKVNGVVMLAHRVSWILAGRELPGSLWVLHDCDTPPCVNPDHLFLGTHQDNVDDKVQKGRSHRPTGEKNPSAKLTRKQVEEIRVSLHDR